MSMGTIVSIGANSFDSYIENTLYGDKIFNKGRHAYIFFERYIQALSNEKRIKSIIHCYQKLYLFKDDLSIL